MTRIAIIVLILFLASPVFSQTTTTPTIISTLNQPKEGKGEMKINQNQQIGELLQKHIEINKRTNTIQGFRIRIYSDVGQNAKTMGLNTKANFLTLYPDIPAYFVYHNPYFKVYIGDFRTKSEALKVYKNIKKSFPKAFIISDKINPPKL